VNQSVVNARLKRYVIPIEQQHDNESEKCDRCLYWNVYRIYACFTHRLWQRVTIAIKQNDQISATDEKTFIEDDQRKQIKERKATSIEWHPRLFKIDSNTKEWIYTYAEYVDN
jgi:oxysterol-binding protein-related protein 8